MSENSTTRAWIEGDRIIATTRFSQERAGLMRSLPDARWDKRKKQWTATATPCAAAKLADSGIVVDSRLRELAIAWKRPPEFVGLDAEENRPRLMETEPWRHQNAAFWFSKDRPAAYLGMEMGTGKSLVAVLLCANNDARRVLIVCPKSVIGVWPSEFGKHSPLPFEVVPLDAGSTKKNVGRAERAVLQFPERLALVINYESAWRPEMAKWLLAHEWDYVVADELHRCKSAKGKASKFLYQVGQKAEKRLGLSGTPLPHDALDAFGQYRFLDAGIFGTSFTRFRSRYAECNPVFPSQVDRWINEEEFKEKLHSIMFQVKAANVLDLPPILHEQRFCNLSPPAQKLYDEIESEALADLGECGFEELIDRALSGEVVADHAFTQLLRLQQVASGHVGTEDGVEEVDRAKATLLQDLLADIALAEPVCVFCQFRHNLQQIREVAELTGRRYGEISGSQKDLTAKGTMPEGVELMGVQWQSGAVGIDLTRSRYAVLYSPTFNWGNYEQGLKRQHRPGQDRPVVVVSLIATGTIDHAVYAALKKREGEVNEVLTP